MKMLRKAVLQIGAPALIAFMAWNAYLAVNHLKQMQKTAALALESSAIQADISAVTTDLTDMETGQRGYLLTEDTSYLQPYTDAKSRIATDLAALRKGLANRSDSERSLESQLEALAGSKQAEMEHSINLRERGYRHRAFMLVASNEGQEYMDKARALLTSLSNAEAGAFAKFDQERKASLSKVLKETILSNLYLLGLTVCLFGLIRRCSLRRPASGRAARVGDPSVDAFIPPAGEQPRFGRVPGRHVLGERHSARRRHDQPGQARRRRRRRRRRAE